MKPKKNLSGGTHKSGKPKRTRQGQGTRSLPKKGKKLLRGQGRG